MSLVEKIILDFDMTFAQGYCYLYNCHTSNVKIYYDNILIFENQITANLDGANIIFYVLYKPDNELNFKIIIDDKEEYNLIYKYNDQDEEHREYKHKRRINMRYNIDFQRYDEEHNKINKSTKSLLFLKNDTEEQEKQIEKNEFEEKVKDIFEKMLRS
jgi:hypothetical protein